MNVKSLLNSHSRKFSITDRKIKLSTCSLLPAAVLLPLTVFVVYPLWILLKNSLVVDGQVTLVAYAQALSARGTFDAIRNTLAVAAQAVAIAVPAGGLLALIRQRTDYRHKKLLDGFVFLSFTIPSYILSVAWIELIGRNGYVVRLVGMVLPDLSWRVPTYSLGAAGLVMGLHLYPLVYFGACHTLARMPDNLEIGARICGAGRIRMLATITLPLLAPSLLSTGFVVVGRTMANFGVLAQLAMPIGNEVLTTRIYSAMSDLNLPLVSVLTLFLVLISGGLYALSQGTARGRDLELSGETERSRTTMIPLGSWEKTLDLLVGLFFLLTLVLPLGSIVLSSFLVRWGTSVTLEHLTLNNYRLLVGLEGLAVGPLLNSIWFGTAAAAVALVLGSLVLYAERFLPGRLSRLSALTAQFPIAVPNMVLAVAAMMAWIHEPFKLYGTAAIIVVCYALLFLPLGMREMYGIVQHLELDQDLSARIMGIPLRRRYLGLFLPQIRMSMASSFLLFLIIALREIPISLLLYSTGTKTLGVLLFNIQSNSYGLEMTSAVACIVILVSLAARLLLNRIERRKGTEDERTLY